MKFSTKNTGTKSDEVKGLELVDVAYVASTNWVEVLQKQFDSLLTRDWKFKEHLSAESLARLADEFPKFVGKDLPERREKKKSHKRKKPSS
jgi:hypothetical protein